MSEYQPIRVGKAGSKIHAGRIYDYVQKGHFSAPTPIYRELCNVVNTKNINHTMFIPKYPVAAGTPITCTKCLRIIAEKESAE